jgi:uncharacterized membrane protein YfcA
VLSCGLAVASIKPAIAVFRALLPLAAGHALAILAVIAIATLAGFTIPPQYLRWVVAAILITVGLRFLIRHPHLRWAGMRVGMGELTLWSFLVASVHGAGLMVLPIFMRMSTMEHASTGTSSLASGTLTAAIVATVLHAASYLLVSAAVALLVFEKLGIGVLRKAWFNVDLPKSLLSGPTFAHSPRSSIHAAIEVGCRSQIVAILPF